MKTHHLASMSERWVHIQGQALTGHDALNDEQIIERRQGSLQMLSEVIPGNIHALHAWYAEMVPSVFIIISLTCLLPMIFPLMQAAYMVHFLPLSFR